MATESPVHDTANPATALASFTANLTFDDVPNDAIRLAERCFIDTVGVGIAGASAAAGSIAAETTEATYGAGPSTLFGRESTAPVPEAAFVNGTASHALDYDDVSTGMDGHPSTTMVAPILAAAEAYDATGRDAITAFVAGFETQCYIAAPNLRDRTGPGLHTRGWHPTAIFGTFAATAAIANILGLDVAETRNALCIAASMPAGLKRNFGSLTKPMHSGQAGAAGVRAALLARNGFDAMDNVLTNGFFPVYEGIDDLDPTDLPTLGDRWAILEEGVDIKKYPSCYATHTSIRATAALTDEHAIDPDDIEQIHLDINGSMADLLVYDDPQTEAQAKFSIPYPVAAAVVFDYIGIATFEPETITTPAVQRVRERVDYTRDPDLSYGTREVTVTIETDDGASYTRTEDTPPATHNNPLPPAQLREKFMECTTRTIDEAAATTAYDRLDALREEDDLSQLTAALAG